MIDHAEYLKDESRLSGAAEAVLFPQSAEELAALLKEGRPVTFQGARTGIMGAAVPTAGRAVNLTALSGATALGQDEKGFWIDVLPGTLLCDLRAALRRREFDTARWSDASKAALKSLPAGLDFLPDPTEETASLGGMFMTNAGGPSSLSCGRTAEHVLAISGLFASGESFALARGQCLIDGAGRCALPGGQTLQLPACPGLLLPLCPAPGQDLVDLLSGSEGMLAAVTSLRLRLSARPKVRWSVVFFFDGPQGAAAFADGALAMRPAWEGCDLLSLEYLDERSLGLFCSLRRTQSRLQVLPDLPEGARAAVMAGLGGAEESSVEEALGALLECFVEAGGQEEDTWAADTPDEIEKFQLLRHAVPEGANAVVDQNRQKEPALHKLTADVSFPNAPLCSLLPELLGLVEESGLDGALFGHLGGRHFHLNLLPRDRAELERAEALCEEVCRRSLARGGSPAAENGVGKTKRELLARLLPADVLAAMRAVKQAFDPQGVLNPGNFF